MNILKKGQGEPEAVKNWQLFLIKEGLMQKLETSDEKDEFDEFICIFGDKTEKATKEFQKREELKSDGLVGTKTLAVVEKLIVDTEKAS